MSDSRTEAGSSTPKALHTVAQGRGTSAHPGLAVPRQSPTLKGLHKVWQKHAWQEDVIPAPADSPFFCHPSFCQLPSPCLPVLFLGDPVPAWEEEKRTLGNPPFVCCSRPRQFCRARRRRAAAALDDLVGRDATVFVVLDVFPAAGVELAQRDGGGGTDRGLGLDGYTAGAEPQLAGPTGAAGGRCSGHGPELTGATRRP